MAAELILVAQAGHTFKGRYEFIEQLAVLHIGRPELGIAAPQLYPFGGFDKIFDWLTPKPKT